MTPYEVPTDSEEARAREVEDLKARLQAVHDDTTRMLAKIDELDREYAAREERHRRDLLGFHARVTAELVRTLLPSFDDLGRIVASARRNVHGDAPAIRSGLDVAAAGMRDRLVSIGAAPEGEGDDGRSEPTSS